MSTLIINTTQSDYPLGVNTTAVTYTFDINQASAIIQVEQTIDTAGWVLVSGLYEKQVSNINIHPTSIVNVIPNAGQDSVLNDADFEYYTNSFSGFVKVYAKQIPTTNILVNLTIIKN